MESKQRLRPWLEAQINGGEIPGLEWINPEKTKFRIPWKHGGKQDWNPDSGRIFKEWARHTGRFREGIDEPDYVKWKTRLRCAFNKAPDIEEVKEESQLEGPDPFRVYILKPRKNGKKSNEAESKPNFSAAAHYAATCQETSAPIPAFIENFTAMSTDSFPSDLKDIKAEDIVKIEETNMSISNISIDRDVIMLSDNFQSLKLGRQSEALSHETMVLKLIYCGKEVMERATSGCRLYYNTFTNIVVFDLPEWMKPMMFKGEGIDLLHLPPCHELMNSEKQQRFWQELLEKGLPEGVVLVTHDDDIYALRFCRCLILFASEIGTRGHACQLQLCKDLTDGSAALTKIFDYKNHFLPALEKYRLGLGPKPNPTVYLLFGFTEEITKLETSSNCIYATITSSKALAVSEEVQDNQVITNDDKCTSAILDYEALFKAETQDAMRKLDYEALFKAETQDVMPKLDYEALFKAEAQDVMPKLEDDVTAFLQSADWNLDNLVPGEIHQLCYEDLVDNIYVPKSVATDNENISFTLDLEGLSDLGFDLNEYQ